jgi:methyl-accepting chemotaxis protein
MGWFNDLRVRWKLLSGFGSILALVTVVGGVSIWRLSGLTENVRAISEDEMAAVVAVSDLQDAVKTIQRDARQALLVDGDEAKRAWQASVAEAQKRIGQDLADLERLLYLPAGQAKLATLKKAYADWNLHVQKVVEAASRDDRDGARTVLFGAENVRALEVVNAATTDLVQFKKARAATVVEEARETGRSATLLIVLLTAGAIVLGLGVGLYIAQSIVNALRPVLEMMDSLASRCATLLAGGLRSFADGDLTIGVQAVTASVPRRGKDELGQLAASANVLRDQIAVCVDAYELSRGNLQSIVGQVRATADGVADSASQLGVASAQTSSAVQQVTQAIQNVASGAQETSHSAQQSNAAVEQLADVIDSVARGAQEQARQIQVASETTGQMANGITQVADNARTVAAASQQTRASAANGAQAVRDTVTGMQEITRVVSDAAQKVEELGRLGEKIGAVVETIDDIAEQTNLLALNAAIEAARAGEHGKGFAVVADEVRKLAERSQRETRAISELIVQVQAGTREAVKAMQTGSTRVGQGAQKADQAGAALAEILSAVEATVAQVTEIASAAQQMTAGAHTVVDTMASISAVVEESSAATEQMAAQAGQVTGAMQSIASVSEENSAATEQVSASTEEMSAQVEEMAAQAEQLSATADQLRALVAQFRLESDAASPAAVRSEPRHTARPMMLRAS